MPQKMYLLCKCKHVKKCNWQLEFVENKSLVRVIPVVLVDCYGWNLSGLTTRNDTRALMKGDPMPESISGPILIGVDYQTIVLTAASR